LIRFQLNNFNIIDPSGDRAFVAPFDKVIKATRVRFSDYFDSAIREVSGMAFNAKLFSLVVSKHSKVNALYTARYQDFNSAQHFLFSSNSEFLDFGKNLPE
jgi:hypothetical protein